MVTFSSFFYPPAYVQLKYLEPGTYIPPGNNTTSCEGPQTIDNTYVFLTQSRGSVIPFTWRSTSIPNTDILMVYSCSEIPPKQPFSAASYGAGQLSHSSGRQIPRGSSSSTHNVRNDPHPPTHPPTNLSTYQTPQPPRYSCTAVHVQQQTVGVFSRRTGSGCRVGAVVVLCCFLAPCCCMLLLCGGFLLLRESSYAEFCPLNPQPLTL